MKKSMNVIRWAAISVVVALSCGCATPPQRLPIPAQIACVFLSSPLSWTAKYGMFLVPWTTVLAKGPYVSERTDVGGTYYRAPPGGLSVTGAPGSSYHGNSPPGMPSPMDGGFYIPIDPSKQPRIYHYFSTAIAPADPAYDTADCSTVGYTTEASGTKMSLFPLAAGGALGGAAGGILGRSITNRSGLSYGQAAGVGAAGGAIGGLIVGAIINSQVGDIFFGPFDIRDDQFTAELRRLVATQIPLHEILPASPSAGGATKKSEIGN